MLHASPHSHTQRCTPYTHPPRYFIPTLTLARFQLEILTNMADNADATASLFISGKDSSSLPLPPELLSKIFGYIPYSDLKNALLVCRWEIGNLSISSFGGKF